MKIPRSFYLRDTTVVARDLLGKTLVRRLDGVVLSGIISETEAYKGNDDPASHAYNGMTQRNKAMFGKVGCAYIYFTYGMYYCMNVVARNVNHEAGAVLIRAIRPVKGTDIMIKNRNKNKLSEIANGPAKITQAMRITKEHYGIDLTNSNELSINYGIDSKKVVSSYRIGIKKGTDKQWNFRLTD